ncbi:hypothetical protein PC116_g34480 [Phytophthora cactorum]|nr:hypothetical protein PC116_g34480 [Phytophthora cactorum]
MRQGLTRAVDLGEESVVVVVVVATKEDGAGGEVEVVVVDAGGIEVGGRTDTEC